MFQHISKRPILTLTVIALADTAAFVAIDVDGSVASSASAMLGVSDTNAYEGDELAVDVIGTTTALAGAAITQGALVQVGSNGKFITKAAGKTVGRALSAATGDNGKFEMLLIPADS